MPDERSYNTTYLIACLSCGRVEVAPPPLASGIIGDIPLSCSQCGDALTLYEAIHRGPVSTATLPAKSGDRLYATRGIR